MFSALSAAPFVVNGPQESATAAVTALVIFLPMALVIAFVIGKETAKRRLARGVRVPQGYDGGINVAGQQNAQLLGGQQPGMGIATGPVRDPKTTLSNEPASGLDPEFAAEVINALRDMTKEGGATMLIVSPKRAQTVTVNRQASPRIMKHVKNISSDEKAKPRKPARKVKSVRRKKSR
jgi:ABC-type histidine transport system ATPase subunit